MRHRGSLLLFVCCFLILQLYYNYTLQDIYDSTGYSLTFIEKGFITEKPELVVVCSIDLLLVLMILIIFLYDLDNMSFLTDEMKKKSEDYIENLENKNVLIALGYYLLCFMLILYVFDERFFTVIIIFVEDDITEYYAGLASENVTAKKK